MAPLPPGLTLTATHGHALTCGHPGCVFLVTARSAPSVRTALCEHHTAVHSRHTAVSYLDLDQQRRVLATHERMDG